MFHGDKETDGGQTDMKELVVTFRNFANALKKRTFFFIMNIVASTLSVVTTPLALHYDLHRKSDMD